MSKLTKETEDQAENGLVPVSRETLKVLEQVGIDAERIGLSRMASGSVAFTMQSLPAIERKLHDAIMNDSGDEPERLPAVANAYANIIKSKASLFKVMCGIPSSQQDNTKRARKSYAPSAPPIDVSPKP